MQFGLYWCVWVMPAQTQNALIKQFLHNHSSARNTLSEFVLSHTCARRLFPGVPTACYSNVDKPRSLAGISWTRVDDRPLHPWVAKLSALLSSPFERTVFLDNDVYLLRNDFLASMVAIARHSDVAMPIDPKRYHVPMGCTAIVNYNTTRARAFFSAARQLRRACGFSSDFCCGGVRRGVSFPSTKYRSLVCTAQRHALPRYSGAAAF